MAKTPKLSFENPCIEKLNRLDWSHGFVAELAGQRIGVRCNSAAVHERLLEYARQGCWRLDESEQPVDALYSLRQGPASQRRGQQNYHLLYLNSARTLRTLDWEELVGGFRDSIWALAAALNHEKLIFRGELVEVGGVRSLVTHSGAASMVVVDPLEPGLDRLLVQPFERNPGSGLVPCVSAARTGLFLLQSCLTPPRHAMPLLAQLTRRVPGFELHSAAGAVVA